MLKKLPKGTVKIGVGFVIALFVILGFSHSIRADDLNRLPIASPAVSDAAVIETETLPPVAVKAGGTSVVKGIIGIPVDPKHCDSDLDCPQCYFCDLNTTPGTCQLIADSQCSSDSQCPPVMVGERTLESRCVPPGGRTLGGGRACSCAQSCTNDSDCPDCNSCSGGVCSAGASNCSKPGASCNGSGLAICNKLEINDRVCSCQCGKNPACGTCGRCVDSQDGKGPHCEPRTNPTTCNKETGECCSNYDGAPQRCPVADPDGRKLECLGCTCGCVPGGRNVNGGCLEDEVCTPNGECRKQKGFIGSHCDDINDCVDDGCVECRYKDGSAREKTCELVQSLDDMGRPGIAAQCSVDAKVSCPRAKDGSEVSCFQCLCSRDRPCDQVGAGLVCGVNGSCPDGEQCVRQADKCHCVKDCSSNSAPLCPFDANCYSADGDPIPKDDPTRPASNAVRCVSSTIEYMDGGKVVRKERCDCQPRCGNGLSPACGQGFCYDKNGTPDPSQECYYERGSVLRQQGCYCQPRPNKVLAPSTNESVKVD